MCGSIRAHCASVTSLGEWCVLIHHSTSLDPLMGQTLSTVRRGADGKGRSRLPVTAVALQADELRHKTYLASRLPDIDYGTPRCTSNPRRGPAGTGGVSA